MCGASKPDRAEASAQATQALQQAAASTSSSSSPSFTVDRFAESIPNSHVVDAMENFLRGLEWKNTVSTFVNSHCAMFADIEGEHGHGQYEVFKQFQVTVDGLLGGILDELGSDPEEFIDACKLHLEKPDRGRRDTAVKELLRQLFTFENFMIFRKMMHDKNAELEAKEKFESEFNERSLRYQQEHGTKRSESEQYHGADESRGSVWNCVSCSFANENMYNKCAVCNTVRHVRDLLNGPQAAGRAIAKSFPARHKEERNHASTFVTPPKGYEGKTSVGHRKHSRTMSNSSYEQKQSQGRQRADTYQVLTGSNSLKPSSNHAHQRSDFLSRKPQKTPFPALCIRSYDARKSTEMSIKEDDTVIISDVTSSEDWWYGEVSATGAQGWVPRMYLATDDGRAAGLYGLDSDNHKDEISPKREESYPITKKGSFIKLNSNSVNEKEFHHLMPVKADREIRAAFEEYDLSRSGSITMKEFGQMFDDLGLHCSDTELQQCMARLDLNSNNQLEVVEFYQLWTLSRDDSGTASSRVTNRLCDLRKRLGESRNIFFGFSFDDWQSAVDLDDMKVSTWSTRDVAKWIAFHGDLAPVRKYITRDDLKEVDGETLLELDVDYLVNQVGIKNIHIAKCMRVINALREKNGLERRRVDGESSESGPGSRSRSNSGTSSAKKSEKMAVENVIIKKKKRKSSSKRTKQIGAWRRGELIGQGAFGKVYQGLDLETGSLVAVKQIVVTMDTDMREELQGEISVMSNISHPNIVSYLGVQWDSPNQQLFIFTEWVPGGSLSDILKKFGKLTEGIVSRYTKQVLLGLEHLHENGVIHLDIKPGNILVDDRGNIKLADFGAARKLVGGQSVRVGTQQESNAAGTGGTVELLGTPYFMAPEMIKQTRHGRGADIWSLSGTVLMMFTGVPPWSQLNIKSTMALLFHISSAETPPPYPSELEDVNLTEDRVVSVCHYSCYFSTMHYALLADLFPTSPHYLPQKTVHNIATTTDNFAYMITFSQNEELLKLRCHLRSFLDICFAREIDDRPSASDLLRHPFILAAPGDDYGLLRQESEGSFTSEGYATESDPGSFRRISAQNAPDELGNLDDLGVQQVTTDGIDDCIDGNVKSERDDLFGSNPRLQTLAETKTSGHGETFLGTGSMFRAPSKRDMIMENNVQSFISGMVEDYNMMSTTFKRNDSLPKGTPPVGAAPNPFGSDTSMFDKTWTSSAQKFEDDNNDDMFED